jgi:hypothetical protein
MGSTRTDNVVFGFTTGEVSKEYAGRADIGKLAQAARTIQNMRIGEFGYVEKRPGFRFIAHDKASEPAVPSPSPTPSPSPSPSPIVGFTENFETPGFENVWTISAGSPNDTYATSPAPLVGSYSLRLTDAGPDSVLCSTVTPNTGDTYCFYEIVPSVNGGGETTLDIYFEMLSANGIYGDIQGYVSTYIDGGNVWIIDGSGATYGNGGTVVSGTHYYVWIDYTYATGAVAVRVNTTAARPVSATATGAWMASRGWDKLRLTANAGSAIFDHIIVSASPIGSNP